MAVKLVLDTLDNVDDAIKPLYVEHDGKYHLDTDAESIRVHRDVMPLANAYERTKADLGGYKSRISELERRAAPDDFDPETWKKLKDGKTDDAAHQQRMVELRKTLEADRDQWKGKFEQQVNASRQQRVQSDLTDALTGAGIANPTFIKAARALLEPRVAMDGEEAMLDIGLGPMTITEAAKRWATSEEGKVFVSPPKGDDARGNDRGHQRQIVKGDMGGDKSARAAAIAERFNIPTN